MDLNEDQNNPDSSEVILYDINTYSRSNWTSEINLNKDLNGYSKYQKSQSNNYVSKVSSWVKNKFGFSTNQTALRFLFSSSKPWNQWKITVSSETSCFCFLNENSIEFYENLDQIAWRIGIKTDFVKICNVFFNEKAEMIVFTDENGSIHFFDIRDGQQVLRYEEAKYVEYENAICKVFFLTNDEYSIDFGDDVVEIMLTLTYSGYLNVFTVNRNKTVSKIFSQSLLNKIPNGIYCAELDSKSEYLIIGSFTASNNNKNASQNGLSLWRVLNSEPWIKNVSILSDNQSNLRTRV
jgi:hypothetical protein